MFLGTDSARQFPKCTTLLQTLEVNVKRQPDVLKAFLQACMADHQRGNPRDTEKIARQAIRWGTPPRVVVREGLLNRPVAGQIVGACGFHNTFLSNNFLEIRDVWFNAFEFGTAAVDLVSNTHRLTTTVLHETVHWVRQAANASDEVVDLGNGVEEAGEAFERLAFGSRVCTPDELSDALAALRK